MPGEPTAAPLRDRRGAGHCWISEIYAPIDGLAIISQKIASTAPKAGNPKANQTYDVQHDDQRSNPSQSE